LPIVGLSFGFLPWSLLGILRHQRTIGAIVLAAAATFSALVTLNQAIAPSALAPLTRSEFYDQVWGIDPAVTALPDTAGLLLNTGYARTSYPAYYPLLGGTHMRDMVLADVGASTEQLVTEMHRFHLQYVYVTASSRSRQQVELTYDRSHFELVHLSTIHAWGNDELWRYLYRLKDRTRACC
jgi:hypothetical protein